MASLQGILNTDFSYPGIQIKVELIVLKEYLSHMEVGVEAACDNYVALEEDKAKGQEYEEYSYIYRIAEEEIPRIIRMPLLVSIYTLFENSVTQLLKYAQEKEEKALGLKDINAKSLPSKFNKYMEHVLGYDFKFSESTMSSLSEIIKLRNCIAHANGNLDALDKSKFSAIKKIEDNGAAITTSMSQLDISHNYLCQSMEIIDSSLRSLMRHMEERYGFN
ncbi:hypothetical protein [Microbulbifer sp. JTAC008]|uniref:hypothetical protein n=1 Tax=Microbulbifer sp. JTAC008 TaxID=3243374 RepID=UPI004039DDEA